MDMRVVNCTPCGDRSAVNRTRQRLIPFGSNNRGMAAIEFAMIASLLAASLLNVSDLAIFMFDKMELENATQMGAQSAWTTCTGTPGQLPATVNCSGLNTALTAALQSSSLGTAVQLSSGYPSEAYYCLDSTGALKSVGAVTATKPANCSASGSPTTTPGDYLTVQTSYKFVPLFAGISLAALLPSTITYTSWVRLS